MNMATKTKRSNARPQQPERKWGPFHGGVSVCCWLNEVETDAGPRFYRTVTIGGRRYRDKKTGEWKDAASLRSTDLPSLILALEAAHAHMAVAPLPGQPADDEQVDEPGTSENGQTPF